MKEEAKKYMKQYVIYYTNCIYANRITKEISKHCQNITQTYA